MSLGQLSTDMSCVQSVCICACMRTEHLLGTFRLGNKIVLQPLAFKQLGIHRAHEIEHLGVRSRPKSEHIPCASAPAPNTTHWVPQVSGGTSQEEHAALLGGTVWGAGCGEGMCRGNPAQH